MQPEKILKLLESNDMAMRLEGISAYFEFLIPPKDDGYSHSKLWKTIRRKTWDNDEADEVIIDFFEYIMRRFKTGNKALSHEELTKEKKAPVINNLEAFAFWKCNLLITDHERKMGRQKEREVITDKAEELERVNGGNRDFEPKEIDGTLLFENEEEAKQDKNLPFTDGDNKQQLIEECIKRKLQQFGKEVSLDGAEAIGMQLDNIPIKEIAKWQKRKVGTQREFIRASKEKAKTYFEPCNKIRIN
jgi:hypothetical protein